MLRSDDGGLVEWLEERAAIWDTARDTRLEAGSEMEYPKKYPKRFGLVSASY